MSYDSHLDFANDLLEFCKALKKAPCTNEKIVTRMICARLYYALFHKALHDNQNTPPFNSESTQLHTHIKKHIKDDKIRSLYAMFHEVRIWADYDKKQYSGKIQNLNNYIAQCEYLLKKNIQCQSLRK